MQYINNMIYLSAETPRDQEIIEKFQRAYVNLKKIVDKLRKRTGGTRSANGSEAYAKLFSILYTAKLRKKNFIPYTPGKIVFKKRSHPG
jgi:hypothetical protein